MWENIKKISIWITAVLGALFLLISAISGIYNFIEKKTIETERNLVAKTTIEQKVDSLLLFRELDNKQIFDIKDNLKKIEVKQDIYTKQTKAISTGLTEHFKASQITNEYIKWLELQLKLDTIK
jgi:hypothetical protein